MIFIQTWSFLCFSQSFQCQFTDYTTNFWTKAGAKALFKIPSISENFIGFF
jgi:hypothetical protein